MIVSIFGVHVAYNARSRNFGLALYGLINYNSLVVP
jgi:hypothetical protein